MSAYPSMKESGAEWIGDIPEHWVTKRLGVILQDRHEGNNPIRTTDILSLTNDRGVIPYSEKGNVGNKSKEDLTGYRIAYPGDIVLNSMNVIIGSVGLSAYFGAVSPVYYVLYPRDPTVSDARYYNYIFQTNAFQQSLVGYGNGIMEIRMRIRMRKLNTVSLPHPPIEEQRNMVSFLDSVCADIDTAIAEAKASIEDYKLLKQSVITQAVTKGLDPNVPMKDSGVEWIGRMPVHWDIASLFQLAAEVKKRNSGLQEQNLLSLSYGKIKRKDITDSEGLVPATFDGYNVIEAGDIVLRLTDLQNDHTSLRVGRTTERGIITSAYTSIRPTRPEMSQYLYYALDAFDVKKGFYGMGSGVRQGMNFDETKTLKLSIPPAGEREAIVHYLDSISAEIDDLTFEKQATISDLESYKKSLIYEIVTGKRRVA